MSNLAYLLYSSTSNSPMSPDDLAGILKTCHENNGVRDITGMLLYKDGCFMQILEGEEEQIRKLFETIQQDPRHSGILEIASDPIRERSFSDWSMGFIDMDQVIPDAPEFEEYFEKNFTLRTFSEDAESATMFIRSFNRLASIMSLSSGGQSGSSGESSSGSGSS